MRFLEVEKKKAESLRQALIEAGLFDFGSRIKKSGENVLLPAKKGSLSLFRKKFNFREKNLRASPAKGKPKNFRDALKKVLTKKELPHAITSFDSMGPVAVVEIPGGLEKKEKEIGETLLSVHPHFETVCKISGKHSGKYRVQPVKVIAGKKNTFVGYRESGCIFEFNLRKVFFSPRLSHERLRINGLIKKGEIVGCLFAGVGPFPIVFCKNSRMKKAYAVELNPHAVKYMKKNVELNKCGEKIAVIEGDVKKVAPKKLRGKCDRVVMPLPKGGEHFLPEAIQAIKPEGGTVHFYFFSPKEDPFGEALELIGRAAPEAKKNLRVLRKKQVRSFSPAVVQVAIDFRVKGRAKK